MTDKAITLREAEKALRHAYDLADMQVQTMRELMLVDAVDGELPAILEQRLADAEEACRSDRANTITRLRAGEFR